MTTGPRRTDGDTLWGHPKGLFYLAFTEAWERKAPAQVNATMMGVAFISIFVGNLLIGWLGSLYEQTTPLAFWGMHAAIAATGGLLVLGCGRWLSEALARGEVEQPLRPSALTLEVER